VKETFESDLPPTLDGPGLAPCPCLGSGDGRWGCAAGCLCLLLTWGTVSTLFVDYPIDLLTDLSLQTVKYDDCEMLTSTIQGVLNFSSPPNLYDCGKLDWESFRASLGKDLQSFLGTDDLFDLDLVDQGGSDLLSQASVQCLLVLLLVLLLWLTGNWLRLDWRLMGGLPPPPPFFRFCFSLCLLVVSCLSTLAFRSLWTGDWSWDWPVKALGLSGIFCLGFLSCVSCSFFACELSACELFVCICFPYSSLFLY